jgi:hypothetical protein
MVMNMHTARQTGIVVRKGRLAFGPMVTHRKKNKSKIHAGPAP